MNNTICNAKLKKEDKLDNGMRVSPSKSLSKEKIKQKCNYKESMFVKSRTRDDTAKPTSYCYENVVAQINLFKTTMGFLNSNAKYFIKHGDETFKLTQIKFFDMFCKFTEDLEINAENLNNDKISYLSFDSSDLKSPLEKPSERRTATYKNYFNTMNKTLAEITGQCYNESFIDENLENCNECKEIINISSYTRVKSVNLKEYNMSKIKKTLTRDIEDLNRTVLEDPNMECETSEKALCDMLGHIIQVNNFYEAKTTMK
jgi:hypothetical protein